MLPLVQQSLSFVYTLYLFTKSDTPLVIIPMLAVAMVLAGPTDMLSFFVAFLWLELHLLAFDIKNQLVGVEEDKLCKPDRPFPSGRLSLEQGQTLYWLVIAMSFALSFYHGLTLVSFVYFCATWSYNEYGLSGNPLAKSPIGAIGYMCYCWGTTFIIGQHHPLDSTSKTAIMASGLIFSLTGHAQDFRDRSGDALLGRRTIPLILPQKFARWSLMIIILAFTYGLIQLWRPPIIAAILFATLAITCALKFIMNDSEVADRRSFRWYELWLIFAHILPIFERMSGGEISSSVFPSLDVSS